MILKNLINLDIQILNSYILTITKKFPEILNKNSIFFSEINTLAIFELSMHFIALVIMGFFIIFDYPNILENINSFFNQIKKFFINFLYKLVKFFILLFEIIISPERIILLILYYIIVFLLTLISLSIDIIISIDIVKLLNNYILWMNADMGNALTLYGGNGGNNFGGPSGPNGGNFIPPFNNNREENDDFVSPFTIISTEHLRLAIGSLSPNINPSTINSSTLMPMIFSLNWADMPINEDFICGNIDDLYNCIFTEAKNRIEYIDQSLGIYNYLDNRYIYKLFLSQHPTLIELDSIFLDFIWEKRDMILNEEIQDMLYRSIDKIKLNARVLNNLYDETQIMFRELENRFNNIRLSNFTDKDQWTDWELKMSINRYLIQDNWFVQWKINKLGSEAAAIYKEELPDQDIRDRIGSRSSLKIHKYDIS